MAKLFFSYSHKDEAMRDELEVHLSMLKRQKIIETWHDRRIVAGEQIDNIIDKNLEDANIILLLVSPYFLASNYCYETEMTRALEKHQNKETHVIPVILHPCDWHSSPFGKLLATPTDGKPISKYPNQHDAYLEVVNSIKHALNLINKAKEQSTTPITASALSTTAQLRSSNLRVKKTFSAKEKHDFSEQSFEYILCYFEGSLRELKKRNGCIDYNFKQIDANHFSAIVYRDGQTINQCKIWLQQSHSRNGELLYSSSISSNDNSHNDLLSIKDDGYILFLEAWGATIMRGDLTQAPLSQQGAAEYFWERLIQPLQY